MYLIIFKNIKTLYRVNFFTGAIQEPILNTYI